VRVRLIKTSMLEMIDGDGLIQRNSSRSLSSASRAPAAYARPVLARCLLIFIRLKGRRESRWGPAAVNYERTQSARELGYSPTSFASSAGRSAQHGQIAVAMAATSVDSWRSSIRGLQRSIPKSRAFRTASHFVASGLKVSFLRMKSIPRSAQSCVTVAVICAALEGKV